MTKFSALNSDQSEEIKKLRDIFKQLDKNGDGTINTLELDEKIREYRG